MNSRKYLILSILIAFALGFISLISYLFIYHLGATLLWAYSSTVTLFLLLQMYSSLRAVKIENPKGMETILSGIADAIYTTSRLQSWRKRLAQFFFVLAIAPVWPIPVLLIFIQQRRLSSKKYPSSELDWIHESVFPIVILFMNSILGLVLSLYALHMAFDLPIRFGKPILAFILASLFFFLLHYTVSPISLATRLRRMPKNPFVSFFIVSLSFYCVLTLAFAGYIHAVPNVTFQHLIDITLDMLRFRRIQALRRGETLYPIDYFVTITGFLYYVTLFQTILRIKEFDRKDEDFVSIATQYAGLGRFKKALDWLERLKSPDPQRSFIQAVAYLGTNQITKAIEAARRYYVLKEEPFDDGRSISLAVTGAAVAPIPEHCLLNLMGECLSSNPNEVRVIVAVTILIGLKKIDLEKYGALLIQEDGATRYPLIFAHFLIEREHHLEARKILELLPACEGIHDLTRRVMILMTFDNPAIKDLAKDCESVDRWLSVHLSEISKLSLRDADDDERAFAVSQLNLILAVTRKCSSTREQEVQFLVKELESYIKEEKRREIASVMGSVRRTIDSYYSR